MRINFNNEQLFRSVLQTSVALLTVDMSVDGLTLLPKIVQWSLLLHRDHRKHLSKGKPGKK